MSRMTLGKEKEGHTAFQTRPKIFLRLRPALLDSERGIQPFCELDRNTITYKSCIGKTGKREVESRTRFDNVFADDCSQAGIFEKIWPEVAPFLESSRTATLMMFGATGSGKTHTMEGQIESSEQCGVCVRLLEKIFERFSEIAQSSEVTMKYVQVYNGRVDDLLSEQKGLDIQSLADGGCKHVKGELITSVQSFIEIYQRASSLRTTAANQVHDQSSRSHCMLQLNIKWCKWRPNGSRSKCISVLNLVDLAGSERYTLGVNPTKEERLRSEESIAINQGLSFLSTVVDQLVKKARTKDAKMAINFRDHNLTKLLASSLKGEGALCLVLCVPNVVSERDENVRTIRFGLSCLTLPVQAKKNVETESTKVQELIHTQSRQAEVLKYDAALHVEEQAHFSTTTMAGETIEQPHNQEEMERLEQDLVSVQIHRVEQDLNLAENNRNLVTLRFELDQGRKDVAEMSQNADKVLLAAARKRLEDREQDISRLESYAGQLQDLVHDLSARRDDYEQLEAEVAAARQESKDRIESEKQRQIVSDLEAKLERKQQEINDLTLNVKKVFTDKQELESNVSRFLQLLTRRSTADKKLADAKERAASLNVRIQMAELSIEVDGTTNKDQDEELRSIVKVLKAELKDVKQEVNSYERLNQDLSRQIEGYLSMMPPTEREVVRRYVHEFQQQAPTVHKLKEEESQLCDDLSQADPSRKADALPASLSAKETSQNLVTGTVKREPDDCEHNLELGFDLGSDLARIQSVQNNDELKRFLHGLPDLTTQLSNFLYVYPSFVPRFVELQGMKRIAELLQKTKHPSTKGNLSQVVVAALADSCALDAACKCGLVEVFLQWFSEPVEEWTKLHEITVSSALQAAKALSKSEAGKTAFRQAPFLQLVIGFVMNSKAQRVIEEACKCLGEVCPNVQQVQEACGDTIASDLCGALVAHFHDGSTECVKAAAQCSAQLCNRSKKFKRMFMNKTSISQAVQLRLATQSDSEMDCLGHALAKINNKELQDEFALVILSLILGSSGSDAEERLQRLQAAAKNKVYEALAYFHAMRMRHQDSVFVKSKSTEPQFPYYGRLFRGSWNTLSAGGAYTHSSYHRNPMYKLHVGSAEPDSQRTHVSIVILHLDKRLNGGKAEKQPDDSNQRVRQSWAYVDIVARSDMKAHLTRKLDSREEASTLEKAQWQDGLKPMGYEWAKLCTKELCGMKASGTFELEADSDYVLIPHTDVNHIQGRFVLAIVSQTKLEVEMLSDEYSLHSFIGTFNSESTGCEDFHLSSWRNGPQLSLSASKDCFVNAILCYKDRDDALSDLCLHKEEDRKLETVNEEFKDRPALQLSFAKDDKSGTRRHIGPRDDSIWVFEGGYVGGCVRSTYFLKGGEFYILSASMMGQTEKSDTSTCHEDTSSFQNLPFRLQIVSTESVQCAPITESEEWYSFSGLAVMGKGGSARTLAFELVASDSHSEDAVALKHEVVLMVSVCDSAMVLKSPCIKTNSEWSDCESGSSSCDKEDEEGTAAAEKRVCRCTVKQEGRVLQSQRWYMSDEDPELPIRLESVSPNLPLSIEVEDEHRQRPATVFRIFGFSTYSVNMKAVDEGAGLLNAGSAKQYQEDPKCGRFIQKALIPLCSRAVHDPAMQAETVLTTADNDSHAQHSQKVLVDKSYLEQIYSTIANLANDRVNHQAAVRNHAAAFERKDVECSELLEEKQKVEMEKQKLQIEVRKLKQELESQRAAQMTKPPGNNSPTTPEQGQGGSSWLDQDPEVMSPVQARGRASALSPLRNSSRASSHSSRHSRSPTTSPVTFPLRPNDLQNFSDSPTENEPDTSSSFISESDSLRPLAPGVSRRRALAQPPERSMVHDLPQSDGSKLCTLQ